MLIRSQDKKDLINLDRTYRLGVTPCYGKDNSNWLVLAENQFTLGTYSIEAKAIKVLDKIQEAYSYSNDIQAFIDLGIPFEIMNNRVFQMPSDEEVEG